MVFVGGVYIASTGCQVVQLRQQKQSSFMPVNMLVSEHMIVCFDILFEMKCKLWLHCMFLSCLLLWHHLAFTRLTATSQIKHTQNSPSQIEAHESSHIYNKQMSLYPSLLLVKKKSVLFLKPKLMDLRLTRVWFNISVHIQNLWESGFSR